MDILLARFYHTCPAVNNGKTALIHSPKSDTMLNWKIEYISEPIPLKASLWRLADRVLLETAMPPVFGKESLLTAAAEAPPLEVLSYLFGGIT